jgi:ribosomal protein S18 acetylase RimI-like enzyme
MINVRQAKKSDSDGLLRVADEFLSFDSYLRVLGIGRLVADSDVCLLVAYARKQTVGYLLARDRRSYPRADGFDGAQIEEITVSENFRNQGIGRILMERFEYWARGRRCRLVDVGGAPAVGFYRALGYMHSGARLQKNLFEHAS